MGSGFAKRKKDAKAMQKSLEKMQQKMKDEKVVGQSGSGLVEITLNGEHEMTGIRIKPECVDPEDIEGLEDLIAAAYKDAVGKLKSSMELPSGFPGLGNLGF